MPRSGFRKLLKKSCGPLLWLAGLVLIIVYAPLRYQRLDLDEGEQVVGFLGKSHELVTLGDVKLPASDEEEWYELYESHFFNRMSGLSAVGVSMSATGSIYVRDYDTDPRRAVPRGKVPGIYGVAPCANGSRLCVVHGDDSRSLLSIVDGITGKTTRTVALTDRQWSTSSDGRTLAFNDLTGDRPRLKCVDVDNGRLLYTTILGPAEEGLLSPNGKYLAIMRTPDACVIDIARNQQVGEIPGGMPAFFSPDSRRLMDANQNVWDILPGGTIQRLSGAGECVFASGGKQIASIDNKSGVARVKFRHLDTGEEFSTTHGLPLAGGLSFGLQAIGDDGDLICLMEAHADADRTKIRQILAWLGFKQNAEISFHWQLIDSRSGTLVHQGNDALLAVSSDGRYVVSSDPRSAHVKLYQLPGRRSLLFIAIAGGIWTALAFIVPRWWRSRQRLWDATDVVPSGIARPPTALKASVSPE